MPRSIEEAKAQLADIKLKKSELSLEKKNVMEQMRQRRAEYSNTVGERATAGKGVGALISKDVGKTAKKVASVRNSYAREALARDLEPLEQQRAEIEASIAKLDQQKLQIDKWVADQKAAAKTSKAASAPAVAKTQQKTPPSTAPAAADDRIAKLKDLAVLKESGILTEEEFQAEKQRILAGG
jgi:hypothetical protein